MKTIKLELHFDTELECIDLLKSSAYKMALYDIQNYLRSEMKYNESLTDSNYELMTNINNRFFEILADNNINLD